MTSSAWPAPLVLHLARRLHFDPRPHLLGLALASNIGSTATLTGNPQNMIIGNLSHISYLAFAARLTPIAVLGLAVGYLVVLWVYRSALAQAEGISGDTPSADKSEERIPKTDSPHHVRLLFKSLTVTVAAVVLFFAGAAHGGCGPGGGGRPPPGSTEPAQDLSAGRLGTAGNVRRPVYRGPRFRGPRCSPLERRELEFVEGPAGGTAECYLGSMSNLVSNVPAVLLFKPVIPAMPAAVQETAWLALAMSSTLAGNLTVLGSVANLIVVESAPREGVSLSFWDYSRVGVPVTLLTLALGIAWLLFT